MDDLDMRIEEFPAGLVEPLLHHLLANLDDVRSGKSPMA